MIKDKQKETNKKKIKEINKLIEIFSKLELNVTDYYPAAEYLKDLNNEELEDLENNLIEDLARDQTMIDYINEIEKTTCAKCKYYIYKYDKCCRDHE